jgi:prevent-host-death family protein
MDSDAQRQRTPARAALSNAIAKGEGAQRRILRSAMDPRRPEKQVTIHALTSNRTVRTVHNWRDPMKIVHKGSEEARNELPTLLEEAQSGRATIITRRGRPVAALVPLSQYQKGHTQQSLLNLEGAARGLWGKSSTATIKKLRDEWSR